MTMQENTKLQLFIILTGAVFLLIGALTAGSLNNIKFKTEDDTQHKTARCATRKRSDRPICPSFFVRKHSVREISSESRN